MFVCVHEYFLAASQTLLDELFTLHSVFMADTLMRKLERANIAYSCLVSFSLSLSLYGEEGGMQTDRERRRKEEWGKSSNGAISIWSP